MARLVPLLCVLMSGCLAADELTRGVAIWPFVLSNDTRFAEIAHVRGGVVIVGVVEVHDWLDLEAQPIGGAGASGLVGEHVAILAEEAAGLYRSDDADLSLLYAPADTPTGARVRVGDTLYTASAAAGPPLIVEVPAELHRAGRTLRLDLPAGYDADYDQVLVDVRDEDGAVLWSNWPTDLRGWLQFASTTWTPARLEIPGEAFPAADALYAVSVFGVIRARDDATFSATLTSRLSGYTTGSALAIPVRTAP